MVTVAFFVTVLVGRFRASCFISLGLLSFGLISAVAGLVQTLDSIVSSFCPINSHFSNFFRN